MSQPFRADLSRPQNTSRPDADLFCRVVDNFGDAGVCWRLARCLAREHGWRVRLWIDAPRALARIKPGGAYEPGVEPMHWTDDLPPVEPAMCVIEAFGCTLPPALVAAMAAQQPPPRWFNLEYLSAEDWVEGCHGLASRHPVTGLAKHFLFPGFTARTGGLLRERDLFRRRDRWRTDPALQADTFARLGMRPGADALQVSLFSYESRSISTLIEALALRERSTQLWVPEGRALAALAGVLGEALQPGASAVRGRLQVTALPFMDQDDYDALLWLCDLNIVRGEDSFVRAHWAARPLLWHIYPQQDDAHRVKLDAFLDRHAAGLAADVAGRLKSLHQGWNGPAAVPVDAWLAFLDDLPMLATHAAGRADSLATQTDLATQLVLFNQSPI